MEAFIHQLADVKTANIGVETRIWQFVVILPGAVIGRGCNICSHVFIENDVWIGNNVTVKNGVQLWNGITVEDDAFIGPNVTFINDRNPRSGRREKKSDRMIVGRGASIGANSTILGGLTIGSHAMIGAGSVVTKRVGASELWFGNPAMHRGFVTSEGTPLNLELIDETTGDAYRLLDDRVVKA